VLMTFENLINFLNKMPTKLYRNNMCHTCFKSTIKLWFSYMFKWRFMHNSQWTVYLHVNNDFNKLALYKPYLIKFFSNQSCPVTYTGSRCEIYIGGPQQNPTCATTTCLNGGTCVPLPSNPFVVCA